MNLESIKRRHHTSLYEELTMYFVKCFNASQGVIYSCLTETWAEAVLTAHLVAEVFEERTNIYKPNETTHCYSVSGQPKLPSELLLK